MTTATPGGRPGSRRARTGRSSPSLASGAPGPAPAAPRPHRRGASTSSARSRPRTRTPRWRRSTRRRRRSCCAPPRKSTAGWPRRRKRRSDPSARCRRARRGSSPRDRGRTGPQGRRSIDGRERRRAVTLDRAPAEGACRPWLLGPCGGRCPGARYGDRAAGLDAFGRVVRAWGGGPPAPPTPPRVGLDLRGRAPPGVRFSRARSRPGSRACTRGGRRGGSPNLGRDAGGPPFRRAAWRARSCLPPGAGSVA
jgi:hypothetical protein